MIEAEEAPSIQERYIGAASSSHLRAEEGRCDLDFVVAAGLLTDGLGSVLIRLRAEYDTALNSMRSLDDRAEDWQSRIAAAERQALPLSSLPYLSPSQVLEYRRLMADIEGLRKEADALVLSERALALLNLKTLAPARDGIGRLALALNTEKFSLTQELALVLAGRVVDAWLDPNCRSCSGRGSHGGTHRGELVSRCKTCGGTKLRQIKVGSTAEEIVFFRLLMDRIHGLVARAQSEMKMRLQSEDDAS